jgi:hypothetical protein
MRNGGSEQQESIHLGSRTFLTCRGYATRGGALMPACDLMYRKTGSNFRLLSYFVLGKIGVPFREVFLMCMGYGEGLDR